MKNSKKGFTLVELIIVVAVIALLAAVLIPTFSSLIQKANQAKDEALVSNLNKAIALSTEKYDTVYDVLGAVKENAGFDVAKISASVSEHEILWDSVNYCFVYKTEKGITGIPDTQTNKDVKDYQYWQFLSKEIPAVANQKYSIYWAGADLAEANVAVGFDAGEAQVTTLNYEHNAAAKADGYNTIIRTNGATNINVNAQYDTLAHHGSAGAVKVIKCAMDSYHEVGNVTVSIEVNDGHLVVEEGAVVKEVVVPANAVSGTKVDIKEKSVVDTVVVDSETAKVEVKENATINNIIASESNENVKIPNSVAINRAEKTVVSTAADLKAALTNESVKYIVLGGNIDVVNSITIDRDLIIDGSEKKFYITASEENGSNSRTINVGNENKSVVVTLKNLVVKGPSSGSFTRGLNIWYADVTISLINCDISSNDYAINITSLASGANVSIYNCNIVGWAALNIWAFNSNIVVNNSYLEGKNDKSESGSNNFAVICFEADTTCNTDEYGYNNKVVVNNTKIKATSDSSNIQSVVAFNFGEVGATACIVELNGCDLSETGELFTGGGQGNKLYLNNTLEFEN